jgi:lysozyme
LKYQDRIIREITSREGTVLTAYLDKLAIPPLWTIGKGTTVYPDGRKVKEGDVITQEEANSLLVHYIEKNISPILDRLELNEDQYCALVSFAYNTGAGVLKESWLGRYLHKPVNKGDLIERRLARVAVEIMQWCMAGGEPILRSRRLEEAREFLGYAGLGEH